MTENILKTHYSAMEIATFKLESAPHAHKNVQEKAKRENWCNRKRSGRGGGLEYEFKSLPQEIQAEILLKTQSANKAENKTITAQSQMSESAWNVFSSATLDQE
ncbi:transposase, partial [Rodentibacter caecimuris]|uniref:DNA-binding protein n=1 Tax=Rodentibacter caecimuris TaxID=1796644 RepID=UPI001138E4BD